MPALPAGAEAPQRGKRVRAAAPAAASPLALPPAPRGGIRTSGAATRSSVCLRTGVATPGEDKPYHRFGGRRFSLRGFLRHLRDFDPATAVPLAFRQTWADAGCTATAAAAPATDAVEAATEPGGGRLAAAGMATARRRPRDAQSLCVALPRPAGSFGADLLRSSWDVEQAVPPGLERARERGGLAFARPGFLRRLHRVGAATAEAERTAASAQRDEAARVRAAARRLRLAAAACGDAVNPLTLQPVPLLVGPGVAAAPAWPPTDAAPGPESSPPPGDRCSPSAPPHARSSSAPACARGGGARRWLGGGSVESAQGAPASVARMLDSGLRYHVAGGHNARDPAAAVARSALLVREGLSTASAARLRRSSLLGVGRLDLPSSGTRDALADAAYGGGGGGSEPPWGPMPPPPVLARAPPREMDAADAGARADLSLRRTDATMAAAAAEAVRQAAARRTAHAARRPDRVFGGASAGAAAAAPLLAAPVGFSRFASAEDEAAASATSTAKRWRAGGTRGSTSGNSAAAPTVASDAKRREVEAVRALAL